MHLGRQTVRKFLIYRKKNLCRKGQNHQLRGINYITLITTFTESLENSGKLGNFPSILSSSLLSFFPSILPTLLSHSVAVSPLLVNELRLVCSTGPAFLHPCIPAGGWPCRRCCFPGRAVWGQPLSFGEGVEVCGYKMSQYALP